MRAPLAIRALVALLVLSVLSLAQDGDRARMEAARARWHQLSPAEKAQLHERYDRLRSMPERDRASLEERARCLAESMRRAEARLSPEDRARLEQLDPAKRRALLCDLAYLDGGDRGGRGHGAMPDAWRERIERAPPEQRARLQAELERTQRERGREKIAEILSRKYGLSAAEIARIEALPEPERWREIEKLKRGADGRPKQDEADLAARMKVLAAARPRASDLMRYAELPIEQRRDLVAKIARQRVVVALRESSLATPAEIEALDALPLDAFRRAIRERWAPSREHHGDRGGGSRKHGPGDGTDRRRE